MTNAPERIWAEKNAMPAIYYDTSVSKSSRYVTEYIRADHVNELVAAAYEAGFYSVVGGEGEWAPPTDATAALAARDARVREAALKEAAELFPIAPAWSWNAKEIRDKLTALIAKDTTNDE